MRLLSVVGLWVIGTACAGSHAERTVAQSSGAEQLSAAVVLASEVEWEQLNPARGDKSPQAANLWGDRRGSGPTGFLVKFVDGFESPPHVHNVSYRGVVISGLIHNDDPNADETWMRAGAFWAQPKGAIHITAARGRSSMAYIEIDDGPYLVKPVENAFESGEEPVNIDTTNIVWLDESSTSWIAQPDPASTGSGPQIAFLWGEPRPSKLNGTFLRVPARTTAKIVVHGASFRGVLIQGQVEHEPVGSAQIDVMEPASLVSSTRGAAHLVSCTAQTECVFYARTEGVFNVVKVRHE